MVSECRWKNAAAAYPLDPAVFQQFDPKATPEEAPFLQAWNGRQIQEAECPYGECDQAGTPSTTLEQLSQHAPMELYQDAGKLVMLDEYPMDIRIIHTDGRPHSKDPDPTFNGDSVAHWDGNTLVIDVIAIDERLAIGPGEECQGPWFPSDQEHVVERLTRPSKNFLIYQVTIEDPVVLAKPWNSAPRKLVAGRSRR